MGLLERDPRHFEYRRSDPRSAPSIAQVRGAGGIGFCETLLSPKFCTGVFVLAFSPGNVRPGSADGGFVVPGVDAKENVALIEEAPGSEGGGNPDHGSRDFGNKIALGSGRDRALAMNPERNIRCLALHDPDGGEDFFGRYALDPGCRGDESETAQRRKGKNGAGEYDFLPIFQEKFLRSVSAPLLASRASNILLIRLRMFSASL